MKSNLPLRNEFPEFWEFLGIPRNSNLFQDMQMSKDKNTLEYLGILGNGSKHQEFPIIPGLKETVFVTYGNYWELLKHQ